MARVDRRENALDFIMSAIASFRCWGGVSDDGDWSSPVTHVSC
jgi:hypothetical protein